MEKRRSALFRPRLPWQKSQAAARVMLHALHANQALLAATLETTGEDGNPPLTNAAALFPRIRAASNLAGVAELSVCP